MNFRATSSEKGKTRSRLAAGFRSIFLGMTALMLFMGMQSGLKAADAANGQALFKANCARCHSAALEKKSTGPALYQVLDRIPEGDWIYKWVKNSSKLIAEGDVYANKVWNENNKASMDPFPSITDAQIDDIMAWIGAYQPVTVDPQGPKGTDISDSPALMSLWNWIKLLVFVIVVLLVNIAMQIARLRGVEFFAGVNLDKLNARIMLGFYVIGATAAIWSSLAYRPYYIASESASEHGAEIDQLFWITMVVVFGVFILTNFLLFFFAYKYGKDGDRKAKYYPENHKLELIWTVVPAITLAILIIFGIKTWTKVMRAPDANSEIVKIEVSGQQWGWILRYTGADNEFGDINVRRIGGDNILGVDMADKRTADDFIHDSLVIPKGATVDLKIRSRDVLHSVYLPHFRVKMDAVPGMDTRFHFVPTKTTAEFRQILSTNEYWGQVDTIVSRKVDAGGTLRDGSIASAAVTEVDTIRKADKFDFELACAEVCGRGHYSMRKVVVVMEPEDYKAWKARASKANLASVIKPAEEASKEHNDMADLNKGKAEKTTSILE